MGGAHSTSIKQESIIKSTSEVVSKIIQTATNQVRSVQNLSLDCTEWVSTITQEYNKCLDNHSREECVALEPRNMPPCRADNVTFKQSVNVDISTMQEADVKSKIENDLSSQLKSSLKQTNSFLTFGNKSNQELKSYVSAVSKVVTENNFAIFNDIQGLQNVDLVGAQANMITLNQNIDFLSQNLQQSSTVTEAATKLANALSAETEQSSGGIDTNLIITIVVIIVAFFLLLFVVRRLYLWSKGQKSPTARCEQLQAKIDNLYMKGTDFQNRGKQKKAEQVGEQILRLEREHKRMNCA